MNKEFENNFEPPPPLSIDDKEKVLQERWKAYRETAKLLYEAGLVPLIMMPPISC